MKLKNILQAVVASTAVLLSTTAFAIMPGFNLGAQLGAGMTDYETDDVSGVTSADIDDTGLAGRVYLGYQANEIWGFELGYTRFSDTDFDNINGTTASGSITEQAVDLVGKGTYTFGGDSLGIYGKLGVGYIKADAEDSISGDNDEVVPVFGAGLAYNVMPNVPVDISWTRFQEVGGDIPSADLFAVGVAYYFG